MTTDNYNHTDDEMDFYEMEDEEQEPDYYGCMSCGHCAPPNNGPRSCPKCCGPMEPQYY